MGKKGKRSGFGGGQGGGNRQGHAPAAASSGLVVVNPAMLQSVASRLPAPKGNAPKQLGKKLQTLSQHSKKSNKRAGSGRNDGNNASEDRPRKKRKPAPTHAAPATIESVLTREDHGERSAGQVRELMLGKEEQCLAGVYWVLLTRAVKRSSVVVLPNAHTTLTAPVVAGMFKSLGFQALAIHGKMTATQRKQSVERLAESGASDKFVLVTTEHLVAGAASSTADLVVLGTGASASHSSSHYSRFASVIVVTADASARHAARAAYERVPSPTVLQQLQARLKLATQIVATAQRLGQSSEQDGETKWASKMAKGADLGGDDDDDDDGSAKKSKNKKALRPDEQRLRALNEKLLVLLARNVEANGASTATAAGNSSATSDEAQHRAEKLKLLGIVAMNAAVGAAMGDERLAAQTQWLDQAPGMQFGGEWHGSVRHGASKDASSLAVRQQYCSCLARRSSNSSDSKASDKLYLTQWRPNKLPADGDAWGGEYGKPCGHNEVAMQHVRPFFPQEVLNSRVCSRRHPAPGNQGYDGCLEFLRLACLDAQCAMTLWDAEQFVFISARGGVRGVKKLQLLALPLAGLQTLMRVLRQWTLASRGQVDPLALLEAIRVCCLLGADELKSARLGDSKLVRRVLAFAIGGSNRVWKQISRMPRPLESDVVYAADQKVQCK